MEKANFNLPQGEINKNWVLFPEKINGKFAILHSISPEVQIDFLENFTDIVRGVKKIKSNFHNQKKPRDTWDTWPKGVGAPPLKTKEGWLVLYHATDKKESHKYKLGAMLLDLDNPNKIIARSKTPILTPDEWYENDGKLGVIYVCGAVIENGALYIYYGGGGDTHVCSAHMPRDELLLWIKEGNA